MDVIEVNDLHRRYGGLGKHGFEAVRGISFSVRPGELFALLGTNGAGKTSALEVIEGLTRPTSGTVRVLGRDPFQERRLVRPRIGIMLQDCGFPTDLTVAETARMWAGTLSAARPLAEVLDAVDLRHRSDVRVKQLSGGERRRLDLAVAILGRPDVLFLDEPSSGLDPESRQRTWRLVRDLLESGTSIALTTHYLEEAEVLADRLAILHRGVMAHTGTPAEVADSRPARITWTMPVDCEPVPDLPGAVDTERQQTAAGRHLLVHTRDLQQTLTALLAWAAARNVELTNLSARPASLEEAFLAISGSDCAPDHDHEHDQGQGQGQGQELAA